MTSLLLLLRSRGKSMLIQLVTFQIVIRFFANFPCDTCHLPGLVNVYITMERSTIFELGSHQLFLWACSIAFCMFTRPGRFQYFLPCDIHGHLGFHRWIPDPRAFAPWSCDIGCCPSTTLTTCSRSGRTIY